MQVLVAVLVITTAAGGLTPLKCSPRMPMPGYEGDFVALLDGRILPPADQRATLADLDEIWSMEIVCWNPETDTFSKEPGVLVMLVRSKASLAAARAPLESLVRAQRAYEATHGRHARTLADLREAGLEEELPVELSASEEGWSASTTDSPALFRCTASEDPAAGGEAGSDAVEIGCERARGLERMAMRQAWDAAGGAWLPRTR